MDVAYLDDFDSVRRDPDPVRRGQRATDLLTVYQQRATELARLRRAAIEEAHHENGMSYTEIANALGVTKGRITQIRATAPHAERAFFGIGPVNVGVPYRYRMTDPEHPSITAEEAQAGEDLGALLGALAFAYTRYQITPDHADLPIGDSVVVCGPNSALLGANLLARDPVLDMVNDISRWWIEHQTSGERYRSPIDDDEPQTTDMAYIARHRLDNRIVVHIAGIHAIGSLGAAHYLSKNLADLFHETGDTSFSLVVRTDYDGLTITDSDVAAGPYIW